MFIIEGPDNVGKTTVAKKIVAFMDNNADFQTWYAHLSKPGEAFDYQHGYKDLISWGAVMDRFHMGAEVYEYPSKISAETKRLLNMDLCSVGSYRVVMVMEPTVYKMNLDNSDRDQMFDRTSMIEHNKIFSELAHEADDFCIGDEVSPYPSDATIMKWCEAWKLRVRHAVEWKNDH